MSKLVLSIGCTVLLLGIWPGFVCGQGGILQTYSDWETFHSAPVELPGGVELTLTYKQCTFVAIDANNKVLRRDVCRYFLNDPRPKDGITEACNHWVYWLRIDGDPENPVLWGRCPTPKHPEFNRLTGKLGPDLWEVIPKKEDRKPNPKLQSMRGVYGETFSSTKDRAPFIDPAAKSKVTINCIDFKNAVFE